ncbi:MAG: ATP-binding cassette domain-containing protein [Succinivibrio sp.]|nr:ATP-binding cassette domain-containing protein [Succinivibrio sp.]
MISFADLCLRRGSKELLSGASGFIYSGERIGIIGRNGCGKSSLFAALQGELSPDSGQLNLPRDLRISSVAQQTPALTCSAVDYVMSGDKTVARLLEQKERAYAQGGAQIALVEERLTEAGLWTLRPRCEELLHGLGFAQEELTKPVAQFSGGWRMRLNLAQALICPADLLLLDEPTNHLDLDTISFLQDYLKHCQATVLCISHDRFFLDSIATHILHFEGGKLIKYPGNYSAYERQRAERIKNERAQRSKEEAALSRMQAFVDRFRYKASKARQAQSMLKAMDRLKLTAVTQEESPYSIVFQDPGRTVDVLADLGDLDAGYETAHPVLHDIKLSLYAGDRVGLLGSNGKGKSTFIKTLCGVLSPLKGKVALGKDVKIGYFAQHEQDALREDLTALDNLKLLDPKAREKDLRAFLGSFNFSGDLALQKVSSLSGGEQARLALAQVAYTKPNLLLLDEPTNHLDLDMREALEVALASYPGALILVSHDRYLLDAICDKLWVIEEGTIREFAGDLNDYNERLKEQQRAYAASLRSQGRADTERPALGAKEQRRQEAAFRESLKPLKQKLKTCEGELEKVQKRLTEIDAQLSDTKLYAGDSGNIEKLLKERSELSTQQEELEAQWLTVQDELEKKESEHEQNS